VCDAAFNPMFSQAAQRAAQRAVHIERQSHYFPAATC